MPASDLHVEALAVAVQDNPDYRPVTMLAEDDDILPLVRSVAALRGTPMERLEMLNSTGDAKDLCALALGALGVPDDEQPLYLVRSGPVPDPYVAVLARLVQELGWRGEDTGITHLDEAGGTAVFDLLDWSTGPRGRATALIVDEPLFTDTPAGSSTARAVAVRVHRGAGPLRVLAWGEGEPTADGRSAARHQFGGRGPCEGWLALHAAMQNSRIGDGDRVLIRAEGGSRRGWALFEVIDVEGLRSVTAGAVGGDRAQ